MEIEDGGLEDTASPDTRMSSASQCTASSGRSEGVSNTGDIRVKSLTNEGQQLPPSQGHGPLLGALVPVMIMSELGTGPNTRHPVNESQMRMAQAGLGC